MTPSSTDLGSFPVQFLNSVLSSFGGDGKQMPPPDPQPQPHQQSRLKPSTKGTDVDAKIKTQTASPNVPSAGQKRRAEEKLPGPAAKEPKKDQGCRPFNDEAATNGLQRPLNTPRPTISTSKSSLDVPYRGTSKPSPASASPSTPSTELPKPAPKKGTYAEIMARAAANKTSQPAIGVIKHKPKDAISTKKELLMRKKGIKPDQKPAKKDALNGGSGRDRDSDSSGRGLPSAKNGLSTSKKVPQPQYRGTAAPKPQPAYKGTMKSGSSTPSNIRDRGRSNSINPPRRGRDYALEDEEDELEEDEEEYDSDESDDMEAGFGDVEQEETAAAKVARKEDEEELKKENQLREEKRRRLAALAAKAPKQKY